MSILRNKLKVFIVRRLENILFFQNKFVNEKEIDYQKEFKKIALILTKPLGIGDLIMCTPFIVSMRKGFPKAKIYLITDKLIFDNVKELDKIIYVKGNLKELNNEFDKLKKEKYDLGIVMTRGINQAFYLNKLKPRFKLGYLGGYKILSNFKLKNEGLYFNKKEHFRNMSLKIARSLGIKECRELLKINYSKEVKRSVDKKFNNLGLDNKKKTIGVNPYVLWETRRWMKIIILS